ncbi:putative Co/Zn/Cd efflux system membrane fusion protein [Arcticibacter svalbardensis MN12-7]|uniref:Putative Co/Zn/Cd efflux system membrane fusion protein n=1 Tax=Arcticibacter svalbardensis MN12-7 TaxID=1150600 RepID=R9GNU1_9SPHI|nr:efflux RND transporter periplasmic adaptor subunit [Arcticibacter svalbardensis]EOR93381.1 putative Co/Zn/Cd efflux system membrane fusion protein [Arcticibacter svalbardensis MN12-7]
MNIRIKLNQTAVVCIGTGLLLLGACSSSDKELAEKKDSGMAIQVTVGSSSSSAGQQNSIQVSGQVEAVQSANISTRVMGYITKLNVKVGDQVSKGQLLVTISNQDIQAKKGQTTAMIAEAEAAFKNAQKDHERFTALYKQQSASAKELDNVTLQYLAAKSRLEGAKQMRNEVNAMLKYTNLTAPFAGIITQKLADEGSMASPGMPLLTIEQNGSYQVSASVPENVISQIHQGEAATISIQAANKVIAGTISQINQSSQFTGGQYVVKVQIPDQKKQGLYAGMYANVSIAVKNTAQVKDVRVMVPLSCIENKDQLTGLYTISSSNTALLRWVRLGKTTGNQVEVLSGLAPGEKYISSADGRLFNGSAIKVNN